MFLLPGLAEKIRLQTFFHEQVLQEKKSREKQTAINEGFHGNKVIRMIDR